MRKNVICYRFRDQGAFETHRAAGSHFLCRRLPAPELFPIEEIKAVNTYVLDHNGEHALQYATTEGHQPLREWIARRMNARLGTSFCDENILITHGSQQALDLSGKFSWTKGMWVLCESPTYLAALSAFKAYSCKFAEFLQMKMA